MKHLLYIIALVSTLGFSQSELTHDVYFNTDEYNVPLTEENRLLLFISSLDTIPIQKISIYGFTDDRGTNDYNLDLSQNRANTIKELFSGYGIDENLITNVNGKGEILLKVLNEDEVHKIRGLNYFKTSYSYVTSESKKTLEKLAKLLVEKDNIYFTIQGHVCCTQMSRDAVDKKTKKRNLSVARAKYIYDYFAKKGVDKRRMKYVGMRRKFPLGGDPQFDRRVEILVTYVGKSN